MIQWVACVPPYDLRAPFFPPHLVAHSEACAPRRCGDLQGNRSEQRGVEGRRGGVGRAGARRRLHVSYAPARRAGSRETDHRDARSASRGVTSPFVSPLCGLTNNGLHRRGSRYDHFCGQLPELSRTTRAHVIQWVACVPPRDLRAPFFPPHLVAHSEDRAPRQSVISKVIGVSDELWRAEGGT